MNPEHTTLKTETLYHRGGRKVPFQSKKQRRWMFKNKPTTAKRWSKKYGKGKNLPERKGEVMAY